MRRIAPDHVAVHRKATGTQDHTLASAYETDLAIAADHHAMHGVGVICYQREYSAVVSNIHAERFDASGQGIHEHAPSAPADPLRGVPAGAGLGLFHEWPGLFATRPDQAVIRHRLHHFFRQEAVLVSDALCHQPFIVGQAALRVEAHLRFVRVGTASHHQVAKQVLGVIAEACLALSRRASASPQVDFST
ncbi:hypothetical protein FQZ97_699260 [compost metagenome]